MESNTLEWSDSSKYTFIFHPDFHRILKELKKNYLERNNHIIIQNSYNSKYYLKLSQSTVNNVNYKPWYKASVKGVIIKKNALGHFKEIPNSKQMQCDSIISGLPQILNEMDVDIIKLIPSKKSINTFISEIYICLNKYQSDTSPLINELKNIVSKYET